MSFESHEARGFLLKYLLNQLVSSKNVYVKLKVLQLLTAIVERGHIEFKISLSKQTEGITEASSTEYIHHATAFPHLISPFSLSPDSPPSLPPPSLLSPFSPPSLSLFSLPLLSLLSPFSPPSLSLFSLPLLSLLSPFSLPSLPLLFPSSLSPFSPSSLPSLSLLSLYICSITELVTKDIALASDCSKIRDIANVS